MANFRLKPSDMQIAGRSVHYAWVIVGVGAVMRLFSSSFRSSSSILIPRLVESFGWSFGQVGLGFAIQWIVSGMFGPPAGWMGDRYGVRWTQWGQCRDDTEYDTEYDNECNEYNTFDKCNG